MPTNETMLTTRGEQDGTGNAKILNFAAVHTEIITIVSRDGRRFALRDDVPTDILIGTFALTELSGQMQGVASVAEGLERFAALKRETLALTTAIFRHSLPDVTEEELADTFSFDEQSRIVQLFFSRHSARSKPRPAASGTSSGTSSGAENSAGNRAQRRHHQRHPQQAQG